jgi:hypothetical protein
VGVGILGHVAEAITPAFLNCVNDARSHPLFDTYVDEEVLAWENFISITQEHLKAIGCLGMQKPLK